jgi:hypothetical protein
MLQSDRIADPVDVAEVEQPGPDDRTHAARWGDIHLADGIRLRVGREQRIAGERDPHGLREGRVGVRAVVQLFGATARTRHGRSVTEVDRPQLMDAGHRDVKRVAVEGEIPRRAQRARRAIVRTAKLGARTGDGAREARYERDRADRMVPRVGDVEHAVAERESLRIAERRRVAVVKSLAPGADDALDTHSKAALLEPSDENAVMAGVGDGDALAVHGDLARIRERSGRDRRGLGGEVERPLAESAIGTRRRDDALDERRDRVGGELARAHSYDRASRIDGDEGGPCAHGVRAPHAELAIVQNRMGRTEPDGGVTNARRVAFGDVLAAVHPDDGDGFGKPLLELPQLRQHMDAVDSTVGPEVEEEQLAAKVAECEPPTAGMQPIERVGKVWGAHGWGGDPV